MSEPATKERADFTEGSIIGSILKMGLPSMFGFLAQNIYSMVDTFWVSRLENGTAAVAAVTFFGSLLWMLFSFNQLVGPGSVAVISRRYGEKEFDRAGTAIKETILLKLFFGTPLAIVGWFVLPEALKLLGAEGEALTLGITYGRILIVGLPIMYASYSIYTALRGVANPNWAMGLMIGSNILNLVFDPILMFGWGPFPEMGVAGAAVASLGSYTVAFLLGVGLFFGNHFNVKLRWRSIIPISWQSMWKIIKIGIPAWLGDISLSGSRLLLTPLVAGFGTAVVAAYGVSIQFFAFGIMVLVGIGLGLSSLIGHNLGSGKKERAKETADKSILLGMATMTVFGVICFLFARVFMGMFFDTAPAVAYGTEILKIFAVGFPFFGAYIMLESIHSGVGLNTPYMIIATIHSWGFQLLPALVFTQLLTYDQTAIWWALSISGVLSSAIFYLYYRRGRWLTISV